MATRVQTTIAAPPEVVFELLATPETYVQWEVGSSAIHHVDEGFPEPGLLFEHSHGKWMLQLRDTTSVIDSDPPRSLTLEARIRPLIVAEVEFHVDPDPVGSRVTMIERVTGGLAKLAIGPFRDVPLGLRNREMLRRLRRLAECRVPRGG